MIAYMNYLQPAGMRGLSKGQQIYGFAGPGVKGTLRVGALFRRDGLKTGSRASIVVWGGRSNAGQWGTK
jgi:hypothetical protein